MTGAYGRSGLTPVERQHLRSYIGKRLRARRQDLGLPAFALARRLDLAPEILEDVERGMGDLDIATLFHAAMILGQPVTAFFDGLPESMTQYHLDDPTICTPTVAHEALALVTSFTAIPNTRVRQRLLKLTAAAGNNIARV